MDAGGWLDSRSGAYAMACMGPARPELPHTSRLQVAPRTWAAPPYTYIYVSFETTETILAGHAPYTAASSARKKDQPYWYQTFKWHLPN